VKAKNRLNLYLLSQDENIDFDTYDSMVVCAEDDREARNIHPDGNWGFHTWARSPLNVKCKLIGVADSAQEKGIICASFNAG
jgi:hypothetical protein